MPETLSAKRPSWRPCRWATGLLFALAALAIASCARVDYRGNLPDPEVLATIKPGKATRDDVTQKIGSPSSIAVFDDETWLYISQQVETRAFFQPKIKERQIVIVSFDKNGFVNDVRKLGLEDGRSIQHVERVTPTAGNELTFMDQLVGNFGRFNKGDKDKASDAYK